MGVKSTHLITRKVATQIIMQKIFECDDSQLAETLESIVDSPYYNFWIIDEEEFEKNKSNTVSGMEKDISQVHPILNQQINYKNYGKE